MIIQKHHSLTTAILGAGALALAACGEPAARGAGATLSPADTGMATDQTDAFGTAAPGVPPAGTAGVGATAPGAGMPGAGATAPGAGMPGAASPGDMGAATGATGQFTNRQLQQFAEASSNIRQGDGGAYGEVAPAGVTRDPNTAVRDAGLSPEDYMRIAALALHDPALRQRITQQPGWEAAAAPPA